jgi:hypothetical protein
MFYEFAQIFRVGKNQCSLKNIELRNQVDRSTKNQNEKSLILLCLFRSKNP